MSDLSLSSEFPPIPTEQWEAAILADLKGADRSKLDWHTLEGIEVKPYYRAEDLPAEFPYARPAGWRIRQEIAEPDVTAAAAAAREAVESGAGEVAFVCRPEGEALYGVPLLSLADMKALLDQWNAPLRPLHFRAGSFAAPLLGMLLAGGAAPDGSIDYDPLGDLLLEGESLAADDLFAQAVGVLELARQRAPRFRPLAVRASLYHECGASAVEELAFTLAQASEYLARLDAPAAAALWFDVAVGSNYFFEIAKLRALRLLWPQLTAAYQLEAPEPFLHARTSWWNKTLYDRHVNLLRLTTEAMAAVLGGCHSLSVGDYQTPLRPPDAGGRHLARNIQILLQSEAHLAVTADAAGGSYYVEWLTDALAREAWKLFQEVEAKGGFLAAVKKGFVQERVAKTADARRTAIATRRHVLIGTNQYPDREEGVLAELAAPRLLLLPEAASPVESVKLADWIGRFASGATIVDFAVSGVTGIEVTPLQPWRAASDYERSRLACERHSANGGTPPLIFLLKTGDPKMRQARADFVASIFACGGFRIAEPAPFDSASAGAGAAIQAGAAMVVLCGSDPDYPGIAAEACPSLSAAGIPVVVAGYPKEAIEPLRAAGVRDFVHIRSNPLEVIAAWQAAFGIGGVHAA